MTRRYLRLKDVTTREFIDQTKSLKKRLLNEGFEHVPVVVNDRLDVCLAAEADGLHVGEDDMLPSDARRLLPDDKLLGVSSYAGMQSSDVAALLECGPDYVGGPGVTVSITKDFKASGEAPYHRLKQQLGDTPLVAIGGLDVDNAFRTVYAGADGLACVSSLLGARDPAVAAKELKNCVVLAEEAKANGKSGDINGSTLAAAVRAMQEKKPLIHCLANYVSMDIMANVLLAAGCSPAMVHTREEAKEFASIASAVSVNVGTLSPHWVDSYMDVANMLKQKGSTPWVLDPVAVGAIAYRTSVVKDLLQLHPTVVRGNPSEILACASLLGINTEQFHAVSEEARGADSALDSLAVHPRILAEVAQKINGVVVMTGTKDYITDGNRSYVVAHDVPGLQNITAAGCSLSSLIGGFLATAEDQDHLTASVHACAYFSMAAQEAALDKATAGPGSLRVQLMDNLENLSSETMEAFAHIERLESWNLRD